MSEITPKQKEEILTALRGLLPDVRYSAQGYRDDPVMFQDCCACYSEYTTDSCELAVSVCGMLPRAQKEQWSLRVDLEVALQQWAEENLSWSGCENCDEYLSVNVHLYDAVQETEPS